VIDVDDGELEHLPEVVAVPAHRRHADVLAIKRAVFELYRLGIDVDAIRRVVYENPRELFGIGG